jgi:ribonuclease BN (tRNA processing enzyme)
MEMTFLGSGSAACCSRYNWHSNILINHNGKNLLIDCGSDARHALADQDLTWSDIDAIYISHLHADHIGSLEIAAFSTYFDPNCAKPKLICQHQVMHDLWHKALIGGLEGIDGAHFGKQHDRQLHQDEVNLSTYFETHAIRNELFFVWQGIRFELFETVHVFDKQQGLPSFGLRWQDPDSGQQLVFTTDTQFCTDGTLDQVYQQADVIFHDCETTPFKSGVHAHFDDLATLPKQIKAKMWLYHCQDNVWQQPLLWQQKAHDAGFRGLVPRSARFSANFDIYHHGNSCLFKVVGEC